MEIAPQTRTVIDALPLEAKVFLPNDASTFSETETLPDWDAIEAWKPDCILLNGALHHLPDVQTCLYDIRRVCSPSSRLLVIFYSSLWVPVLELAAALGLRASTPSPNWMAPSDVVSLLRLAGFELVARQQRVLLPVRIPILSDWINRWLAPLPVFRLLCLANIAVARPLKRSSVDRPSVSIIVPTRNEAGNIVPLIERLPTMGPDDEVIFVEGDSSDATWEVLQAAARRFESRMSVRTVRQTGKGKADAVRLGLSLAAREILMVFDADLTVPPEELPKFYRAITSDLGEFVNGSRLVYAMEPHAMRFANILGNKFFALVFTFLLGQSFKDTLCGTKVVRRADYERLRAQRAYFGEFDPFGDFELLFGAAKLGLKIVEVPVRYRPRVYGTTNIRRWRQGWILLRMVAFAARRVKFI